MAWGATKAQWAHFKKIAKVDLLPVVSNPDAEISPTSKMKGKGKTPSRYNGNGQVSGFPDWTDHQATAPELDEWAKQPDYGICVQTRRIRALDIDVDDAQLAARILSDFEEELCELLPVRSRPNSGKRLAVFILDGEIGKRSFKVDGGLVEFLGNGQQFIAAGLHTSGVHYQWKAGLPEPVTISREDFDRAWAFLVERYAVAPERRTDYQRRAAGEDLELEDPVALHLVEHWETYGTDRGKLFVCCPWKDGHSVDSGESETAWLLAGTKGYERGHFECLHASCQGRGDGEFFEAVGYRLASPDEFDDLTEGDDPVALYLALAGGQDPKLVKQDAQTSAARGDDGSPRSALPLPGFIRDKSGRIETCIDNVVRALLAPQACQKDLAFDEFRGELMISEPDAGAWRSLSDADAVELRIELESGLGFKDKVGKDLMRDALEVIGSRRKFDSAIEWLTRVVPAWDGVSRIERFYPDYFATEDSDYTRACGRYLWTAQAGRVLEPGIKADMVPVLVGPQGARKSSGIEAISPSEEFFSKFDLEAKDDDKARKMRGCLVGELDELRGLQTKDRESILAWITRRHEKWTPKYKEYETTLPRRVVFQGSTNKDDFLDDPTGERRWLPMYVLGPVDVDGIVADRLQLWAEARERFLAEGLLFAEAERLARSEHHKFKHVDAWHHRVSRWLDEPDDLDEGQTPRTSGCLRADDVLVHALGMDVARIKRADQQRVGAVLTACGMKSVQRRVANSKIGSLQPGTTNLRVWVDAASEGLV